MTLIQWLLSSVALAFMGAYFWMAFVVHPEWTQQQLFWNLYHLWGPAIVFAALFAISRGGLKPKR